MVGKTKLKLGKAPGVDGIRTKMLKRGIIDKLRYNIIRLFVITVWFQEQVKMGVQVRDLIYQDP